MLRSVNNHYGFMRRITGGSGDFLWNVWFSFQSRSSISRFIARVSEICFFSQLIICRDHGIFLVSNLAGEVWNVQLWVDIMDSSVCFMLLHFIGKRLCDAFFWIPFMALLLICTDLFKGYIKLDVAFSLSRWHLHFLFIHVVIMGPLCLIIVVIFMWVPNHFGKPWILPWCFGLLELSRLYCSWRPQPCVVLCICIYNLPSVCFVCIFRLFWFCHHPVLVVEMLCWFWLIETSSGSVRKWLCLWLTHCMYCTDRA